MWITVFCVRQKKRGIFFIPVQMMLTVQEKSY